MPEEKRKLTLKEKQDIAFEKYKENEAKKKNQPAQNEDRFYCTNKALMAEMIKWRDSNEDPEKRIISEELGNMIIQIATRLTNHSRFRNYPYDLKQEMISYACFKCVQGLKNFDFRFKNIFAYITTSCYNAFINTLTKHYKQVNIRKNLIKQQLSQLECVGGLNSSKIINSFLKDYLGLSDDDLN